MKTWRKVLTTGVLLVVVLVGLQVNDAASGSPGEAKDGALLTGFDRAIAGNSRQMVREGRQIFRFDTFGDEAFWGDLLGLHKAIQGTALGGVATLDLKIDGVSPKTALGVGLKVDVEALPRDLVHALRRGQVNLDDPATTLALLRLNAVVGLTGFFNTSGNLKSIGIQCALCHSTVDNSFAPGIGRRLDGWANRDLNIGLIASLAPNLQPVADLLSLGGTTVDVAAVKRVFEELGAREVRRGVAPRRQRFRRREIGPDLDPARVRISGRQPAHLDRLGIGHALECVCRQPRDARQGNVLRPPAERRGRSSPSPPAQGSETCGIPPI